MKKRVIPDKINYILCIWCAVWIAVCVLFLCFVVFGIIFTIVLGHGISLPGIVYQIGWICIFIGMLLVMINSEKIGNYCRAISSAYRWSIRAALETEFPEGIIYILENTLKQLKKVGVNNQPYKQSESYSDGTSDVRGFPNQTNLRNAIRMAQDLSREWDALALHGGFTAQIDAMERVKTLIRPEDMWLDRGNMRVYLGKELYWFYYDESDRPAVSRHPGGDSPHKSRPDPDDKAKPDDKVW